MTTVSEILPALRVLPRIEKLRLIQWLVSELAQEEDQGFLASDTGYPIWTPYDAYEAAETLLKVLEEEKATYAD